MGKNFGNDAYGPAAAALLASAGDAGSAFGAAAVAHCFGLMDGVLGGGGGVVWGGWGGVVGGVGWGGYPQLAGWSGEKFLRMLELVRLGCWVVDCSNIYVNEHRRDLTPLFRSVLNGKLELMASIHC